VRGAGFVETRNQRIVIQTEGQSVTPDELREAVLSSQNGTSIRLKDVAQVLWAVPTENSESGEKSRVLDIGRRKVADMLTA